MAHNNPHDATFVASVSALSTRRDNLITSARVAGGGIQITGFSRIRWQALSPVLVHYDKHVVLKESGQGLGGVVIVAKDVVDDTGTVQIEDVDVIPAVVDNLEYSSAHSISTPSVTKSAFRFKRHGVGITTAQLEGIQNSASVLDIEINGAGVFVYSVKPSRILSSLCHTVKRWKQAPHKAELKPRPSKVFTRQKGTKRKKRRGWHRFRL
jgi:hypothetical protein